AAAAGAQLVALPELCWWRGPGHRYRDHAVAVPGPFTDHLGSIAARYRIHLAAGTVLEAAPEGRCYNTALLFGPDGRLLARYRKIHLFDVAIEGGPQARESERIAPGEAVVAVETELGVLGLAICYDLRFPELFRRLADRGVEVVLLPSAFTRHTGRAHWQLLLRARAVEDQCYVVAPGLIGPMENGTPTFGHSMVVDPWGRVVARLRTEEGIATAPVDLERLHRIREQLPALAHRRLAG
ncbi:MAG: carbon-nitrogen hydrolase family protein, partial [Nitrospirae bacterium]